jgi:type VI secretion system secreted protein Hcp
MAAADIFLDIPGVAGESQDSVHSGKIDVLSFSWGESNQGTSGSAGGAGAGKAIKQDLTITKYVDKSSNVLLQACAQGTHYATAKLFVRKAGTSPPWDYLEFDLAGGKASLGAVFVSSYNIGGSGGDGVVPIETITLNFASVVLGYTPQLAAGGKGAQAQLGWDFGTNQTMP